MASSGGAGVRFSNRNWEGGHTIFTSKFFGGGGFSFETRHFFENHPPPPHPGDVINDRSLMPYNKSSSSRSIKTRKENSTNIQPP